MSFDREERLNINTCRINDLLTLIFRPELKSKLKYSDEKKKETRLFSLDIEGSFAEFSSLFCFFDNWLRNYYNF